MGNLLCGGLVVVGLIEQEVGSELLIFVACEVGLDGLVAIEAEAAQLVIVSLMK